MCINGFFGCCCLRTLLYLIVVLDPLDYKYLPLFGCVFFFNFFRLLFFYFPCLVVYIGSLWSTYSFSLCLRSSLFLVIELEYFCHFIWLSLLFMTLMFFSRDICADFCKWMFMLTTNPMKNLKLLPL